MICMGAGWRGALNYALDFGNMLILSCFVSFTVLCIHVFSKFILLIYIRMRQKNTKIVLTFNTIKLPFNTVSNTRN